MTIHSSAHFDVDRAANVLSAALKHSDRSLTPYGHINYSTRRGAQFNATYFYFKSEWAVNRAHAWFKDLARLTDYPIVDVCSTTVPLVTRSYAVRVIWTI